MHVKDLSKFFATAHNFMYAFVCLIIITNPIPACMMWLTNKSYTINIYLYIITLTYIWNEKLIQMLSLSMWISKLSWGHDPRPP